MKKIFIVLLVVVIAVVLIAVAVYTYSWGIINGHMTARIDNIYDKAGYPDKITSIVMFKSGSSATGKDGIIGSITITDIVQIESFCEAIMSSSFEEIKRKEPAPPYFVGFNIYH